MSATSTTASDAAVLLARCAADAESGILTIRQGRLKRLFCMKRGWLVFGASNLIEEQLGEVLVRDKIVTTGDMIAAKVAARQEGKTPALLLHESPTIEPARIERALDDHLTTMLLASLALPGAEATFDRGSPKLDAELTTRLSCVPLILAHTSKHPRSIDQVRVRIGPPNMRPERSDGTGNLLDGVRLEGAARYLVESCDGERDVTALVKSAPDGTEETLRALHGLLLLGVVRAAEVERTVALEVDQVTRDEADARVALAVGADYYLVLGVDPKASPVEIREAYYLLARRYHPDRFRSGPLADLVPKVERYFTQVTEAHNTLSDPELRAAYDVELAEFASGKQKDVEQDSAFLAKQNFARARALIAKRQLQAAVTFLENAVQLDGDNAEYHIELGRVLSGNPRRRDEAERHLQRSTEIDPTATDGYMALGDLYRRTDRFEEAKGMFREVLRWEPGHRDAAAALAELGG